MSQTDLPSSDDEDLPELPPEYTKDELSISIRGGQTPHLWNDAGGDSRVGQVANSIEMAMETKAAIEAKTEKRRMAAASAAQMPRAVSRGSAMVGDQGHLMREQQRQEFFGLVHSQSDYVANSPGDESPGAARRTAALSSSRVQLDSAGGTLGLEYG